LVKLFAQKKNVATFWSNYLLSKKMVQILVKYFAQQKNVTFFWSKYLLSKKKLQILVKLFAQQNNIKKYSYFIYIYEYKNYKKIRTNNN